MRLSGMTSCPMVLCWSLMRPKACGVPLAQQARFLLRFRPWKRTVIPASMCSLQRSLPSLLIAPFAPLSVGMSIFAIQAGWGVGGTNGRSAIRSWPGRAVRTSGGTRSPRGSSAFTVRLTNTQRCRARFRRWFMGWPWPLLESLAWASTCGEPMARPRRLRWCRLLLLRNPPRRPRPCLRKRHSSTIGWISCRAFQTSPNRRLLTTKCAGLLICRSSLGVFVFAASVGV